MTEKQLDALTKLIDLVQTLSEYIAERDDTPLWAVKKIKHDLEELREVTYDW